MLLLGFEICICAPLMGHLKEISGSLQIHHNNKTNSTFENVTADLESASTDSSVPQALQKQSNNTLGGWLLPTSFSIRYV